ncbi:MAG: hypothetical protein R3F18_17870 [Lysobacterales bacterium]|nr:hypothetical protein [Xanthomonadales bacterium]MCB1611584.1 hypothetical protein [Xanthomonadales bacterium]MCP5475547.1 hypothetical protein [Rhodanobacteraceae bacterium]
MTLRIRYYLAILPLFVGLGLVNSLLVYTMERNELRWGLRERAQGVAASVAGFWDVMGPEDQRPALLKRYSQRLGGLSVRWFDPEGQDQWRPRDLFSAQVVFVPQPPPPTAEISRQLLQGELDWTFVPQREESWDLIVGYAPVRAADGSVRAVVAVSERETGFREAMASLRLRLIGLLLALLLAGIGAAELITRVARRELGALTAAAEEATHGRYRTQLPPGRIRELNDLGGTLLTMTSLLADESHQTRRAFFRAELLPGQSELALGYRNYLEHPLPAQLGPASYAFRRLGATGISDFCGWRESASGWVLVLGRTRNNATLPSPLQELIHADAARDYLLGAAVDPMHNLSWEQALADFPCDRLQIVEIAADGDSARLAELAPDGASLGPWTSVRGRLIFGTLDDNAASMALAYSQQFPDRMLEQVADELAGLMAARFSGILVLCDLKSAPASERSS